MAGRSRLFAGVALLAGALLGFFTGRGVEERVLAANAQQTHLVSAPPRATIEPFGTPYRRLVAMDIVALPFADFFEALRAAPQEAREKWASELAAMPEGPQRRAAVSGFYKLLVQFDPAAAVKTICEIGDVALQKLALDAAVDAAPGFALPQMAKLTLTLQDRIPGKRDHFSDVLLEWAFIDPPAAAQFIDDHKEAIDEFGRGRYLHIDEVISIWAAVDPAAAKEWIDRTRRSEGSEVRQFFIEGWYQSDRAAAVSYALANADDPDMAPAIGAIVCNLYSDSKEEATKFIESLPENKRRDALTEAFRRLILFEEEDTGDAAMTPRAIASWMVQFPPAYWEDAVGGLFGNDSTGAANMLSWIQQLPPGVREAAAAQYFAPFDQSPAEKIRPVLQAVDPILRDQLLRGIVKNGLSFDEARTAIASAPLSEEQKNHLLDIIAAVEAEMTR